MSVPKQEEIHCPHHGIMYGYCSECVRLGIDQPTPTDRDVVIARYPDARCIGWRGPYGLDNLCYYIYPDNLIFCAISRGWTTEALAWADARAKLAQPEELLMEICPVCGKKECDCYVPTPARMEQPASEGGSGRTDADVVRRAAIHAASWAAFESASDTCWAQSIHDEVLSLLPIKDRTNYGLPTPPATGEAAPCCFIPCSNAATWQAWDGPRPDDYIDACDDHLGHLLSDKPEHKIYPIHTTHITADIPKLCPKCGNPIWGEGWNPENGDRFYSHISAKDEAGCDKEVTIPATERAANELTSAHANELVGKYMVDAESAEAENQELRRQNKRLEEIPLLEKILDARNKMIDELRRKVEEADKTASQLAGGVVEYSHRAEKAEAELATLREEREKALVLIKDWWAHPSAHSNPVGPMLREAIALLTAKEGQ